MSIASLLRLCGGYRVRSLYVQGARKYGVQHESEATSVVECLDTRGILRVSGAEVSGFLQGVITNDMRHFDEGASSMYTMFLNTKGRVLCDTIIYKTNENNAYFIECDSNFAPSLQKHLKLFRVRKKIDIDSMDNVLKVWVMFRPDVVSCTKQVSSHHSNVAADVSLDTVKCHFPETNVIATRDPRLPAMGVRVVCPAECNLETLNSQSSGNTMSYRMLRYRLGVGEGVDELPPEKCFPLEVNCDYLHGVSFHKGCYIGQELTARTHHTGVVRKRIMPLMFDLIPKNGFVVDMPILSGSSEKVIGKLKGAEKETGIGMLRIAEALECRTFKVSDGTGYAYKPSWWPQSLPKDRISAVK